MENRKIIAREVAPELVDFSGYFDDEGLTEKGGDFCYTIIIVDYRNGNGFNMSEYKNIHDEISDIICEFDANGLSLDIINQIVSNRTRELIGGDIKKVKQIEMWAKYADADTLDSFSQYLTIITGKKWDAESFSGYCQGDFCRVIFCTEEYSEEHITEIGKLWLGCGSEFIIDDCHGYYVIDDIRWKEGEELRKALAEMYGCDPGELQVYLYDGETRTAKYKLMESA